ncbi:hypothetical protein GPECTOR_9g612 [Gonium pectorale]|uniref:Uncharacterized protein n=1 Tax=Gonium pectorale TaxID=33097 RepID=A0A150GSA0_GONPE|nr:hypothetical protein GPECTOR_9g612 [Gonium pectorale]|eukprot:KXZ52568.1 hypothetical protein GPECTOR_9g612 [Gonium pectorale]
MVNVDFASPSLLLGTALIGCGVLLLNLRNFQNKVSRDADIVVAAMVSIVGSTLIFQGWRLDPLLLLCQALTTSVAFWYGLETFRLRSKEADMLPPPQLPPGVDPSQLDPAQLAAQQQFYQQQQGFPPAAGMGAPFLPPGRESYYPWGAGAADAEPASTSGRAAGQMPYGGGLNPYAETIQYDYYGNPILPSAEPVYGNAQYESYGAVPGGEAAAYGGSPPYSGPGPYGAPAQGPQGPGFGSGPGPAPTGAGAWSPAGAVGPADYDGRGFAPTPAPGPGPAPGPSYGYSQGAGQAYGDAYGSPAGPAPARPQPQPQYALPPVASGSGAPPADGAAYGAEYGTGYGTAGIGSPGSPDGGAAGAVGEAGGAVRNGLGLGPGSVSGLGSGLGSAGVAGRAQSGRLDLYGKIDDWE